MSNDLLKLLEGMDDEPHVREGTILKAPFCYPGAKSRAIKYILPHLPYYGSYIEPFGGSAAILLARKPAGLEVYNDAYGGVVDFYRCIRDDKLLDQLVDRLKLTLHSREEFEWCKETWQQEPMIVERAARWYYMVSYSFAGQGRNFGRSTNHRCVMSGKILNKLPKFQEIHERLRKVQIENQDWYYCMKDYDQHDAVFYCDPPYYGTYKCYKDVLSKDDHKRFLDTVFEMKGFVAVSSYPNELYDSYEWDDFHEWEQKESTTSCAFTESNNKADQQHVGRATVREALYIKEAQ